MVLVLRHGPDGSSDRTLPGASTAPVDLTAVVRRVQLAYVAGPDGFEGFGPTYHLRVSDDGEAAITTRGTGAGGARPEPLRVETRSVSRGDSPVASRRGRASTAADGTLRIARGSVVETLANREDGVEQSWTFPARPPGEGDLTVRVGVAGLAYVGATNGGLHFAPPGAEAGFRYGNATWIDARGTRTAVPARFDAGEIAIAVPGAVVEASTFPAVLDPVISPELGMDAVVVGPARSAEIEPAVASDGTDYLVVWQDSRTGMHWKIFGARVAADGALLDPTGFAIGAMGPDAFGTRPSVAFNGTDYLVVWEEQGGAPGWRIRAARVDRAGNVLDAGGIAIDAATRGNLGAGPRVASDGAGWLVVWNDWYSVDAPGFPGISVPVSDVLGKRVDGDGSVLDATAISIAADYNPECDPAVAFDGAHYLVVWTDRGFGPYPGAPVEDSPSDIRGVRVSPAGVVVDPGPIAISTAPDRQLRPAVAFDGTSYLVAWEDFREGDPVDPDVYGARVSPTGAVLDASGIPIAATSAMETSVAVASDGASQLVVWSVFGEVRGVRIGPDGTPLDPAPTVIVAAPSAGFATTPAAASAGPLFLVAAELGLQTAPRPDVVAARVGADGALLDATPILVSPTGNRQEMPAAAFDGASYLVVWQDERSDLDVFGARVTPQGDVLDPSGIAISSGPGFEQRPDVAFDGTSFLVVWSETADATSSVFDVRAARVSPAGAVLDPAGIVIATGMRGAPQSPAVASGGASSLVTWTTLGAARYDVLGARLSSSGAPLDPGGFPIAATAAEETSPAVAFDGSSYLVVWSVTAALGSDIHGARVSPAGTVLDPSSFPIQAAPGAQFQPSLSFDGANYLVVWGSDSSAPPTHWNVEGARVSPAGVVLDTTAIPIATGPGDQYLASTAFDGTNHVVVWTDARGGPWDVYGARITPGGGVLDEGGFPISFGLFDELAPAVAAAHDGTVLVAYSGYDGATATRIRARIVTTGVPPSADADGDGIVDAIDVDPAAPSAAFDDGAGTAGSILANPGLAVGVDDLAPPVGVRVSVGAGAGSVTVSACGFTLAVLAGSVVDLTCGSLTARVISGEAQIVLGGGLTTVTIPEGVTGVVIEDADGSFTVENLGGGDVTVTVGGVVVAVGPGEMTTVRDWEFQGFAPPVDAPPVVNVVNAGRAVPLKWRLLHSDGTPVTDLAAATILTTAAPCDAGATADALEEGLWTGSGLQNLGDGHYQLNWKTEKAYAGTCRVLRLDLGEGVTRDALFHFTP